MPEITRRDVLKTTGAAMVVAGIGIPTSVRTVTATTSGEPELTLTGTIPSGTGVSATVEEYENSDGTSLLASQTIDAISVTDPLVFDSLAGEPSSYYVFDLTFTGGDATPEIDLPLLFEIPAKTTSSTTDLTSDEWVAKDDETTIVYDESYLRQYQPLLIMSPGTRRTHQGMYGYVCQSPNQDTDVLCYWSQFTHQDGLPMLGADSHLGDHEPIYVFVDKETEQVDTIVYTGYHWYAAEATPSDGSLSTIRRDFPTHATFEVVNQWHNYRHRADAEGAFVALESWPAVRAVWKQNGFYEPADPAAIEDPWVMIDNDSWWDSSRTDSLFARIWSGLGLRLGWYGGANVDDLR